MIIAKRTIAQRSYVAIPARTETRDVELQARVVEIKRQRAIDDGFRVVG